MKRNCGFTLVEMLVVIGIIALLIGVSIPVFSYATKAGEKRRAQDLVEEAEKALTQLRNKEGAWPPRIAANGEGGDHQLDARAAFLLAKANVMSLTTDKNKTKLDGLDQFGVVTPWALDVIRRQGRKATLQTAVGSSTVQDNILHFAIDGDGDNIIEGVSVGGENLTIRGHAAVVWSIGKSGGERGKPWPYSKGKKRDDVYSWSPNDVKK